MARSGLHRQNNHPNRLLHNCSFLHGLRTCTFFYLKAFYRIIKSEFTGNLKCTFFNFFFFLMYLDISPTRKLRLTRTYL